MKSRYLRIKCECGNEQNIFGNATSRVNCLACSKLLAEPGGSHARVYGKILRVL